MAKQKINQGTTPTGAGGDTFRSGSAKLQANDDELYAQLGAGTDGELPAALPISKGGTGATTAAAARTALGALGSTETAASAAALKRTGLTSTIDLDTVIEPGFYTYPSTVINAPEAIGSWLMVNQASNGWAIQEVHTIRGTTSKRYFRVFNATSWSAWQSVYTSIHTDPSKLTLKSNVQGEYIELALNTTIRDYSLNGYQLSLGIGGITMAGGIKSTASYTTTTANAANINIASDGTFARSTSSLKYKTDVENLADAHADHVVFNSRPIWYRSNCENDNPEWSWYGLGAEEMALIDPRLVHWRTTEIQYVDKEKSYEEDGEIKTRLVKEPIDVPLDEPVAEGVQYDRIVPHLLSVIQRMKIQMDALEEKVVAIECAI